MGVLGTADQAGRLARSDSWLRRHRPRLVRILLGLQVFGLLFFIAGTHGAFGPMPSPPTTTDFASFYTAGRLANQGRAGDAYDAASHGQAEAAVIAPGVAEKRFLNPPVFLLVCAPLARLPYLAAFVLFEAITFAAWLALAARIAGSFAQAVACLAAIPAVWWALGWGQNSFLSASLMAAGTLLLTSRPLLAGAALGALCFKPHFGVLIPVALLAGRHWRAVLGAALSMALLVLLSIACFGLDAWRAFLAMAAHSRQTVETGIALAGHIDLAGAVRLAGAPAGQGWVVQAVLSLTAAACVAWAWSPRRCRGEPELARAILVAGTMAAMPFLLFYDLVMGGVAAAWLVRALQRRERPMLAGDETGLAVCMVLSLVAFPAAVKLHLAVGVCVAPLLVWLSMRRLVAGAVGRKRGVML